MDKKKIRKVSGRGTSIREVDYDEQNWAGDAYRKKQHDSISKVSKNMTIHVGRGVRTTILKDMPEPQPRPSTEGRTRITNRGTGSRKSKNKGSKS